MKKNFIFLIALPFLLFNPVSVTANEDTVSTSASVNPGYASKLPDRRVIILRKFFEDKKSPLVNNAEKFVYFADKYAMDYRLVPAITGVESSFGKRMPENSYNAYGWANGDHKFKSWDESIEVVNKILKEKYYDRGLTTIKKIGHVYAPPGTTWAYKVKYFMNKIDPLPLDFDL